MIKTQASPIGMASASQADFGGSDSRRLLHKNTAAKRVAVFLFQKAKREEEVRQAPKWVRRSAKIDLRT